MELAKLKRGMLPPITSDAFDDVLKLYMDAAFIDLEAAGIIQNEDNSALYDLAVICFTRANYDSVNYDAHMAAYKTQKIRLALMSDDAEPEAV